MLVHFFNTVKAYLITNRLLNISTLINYSILLALTFLFFYVVTFI